MHSIKDLKVVLRRKARTGFHAGDYGKPDLDLYFDWVGEPKTNPAEWYETLKWGAGLGVEAQMMTILKDSGIVDPAYDQKKDGRVNFTKYGIEIHGYIDAITKDGMPIEIKSINNKNDFDIRKYREGNPRESYVGQLATYLEFTGKREGVLFAATVDGLNTFWLPCYKVSAGKYKCGNVSVDVYAEYKRWAKLYRENISKQKLPDVFQYLYKHDVTKINWKKQSKSSITKARNGKAVIGDWQVQYSDWKDKIVELQGTTLGYTNDELEVINKKTKGYSTWK